MLTIGKSQKIKSILPLWTHQHHRKSSHHRVQDDGLNPAVLLRSWVWFAQGGVPAVEALLCRAEGVGELAVVNQHPSGSQDYQLEVEHVAVHRAAVRLHRVRPSSRRMEEDGGSQGPAAGGWRVSLLHAVTIILQLLVILSEGKPPPSFRSCGFPESSDCSQRTHLFCLTEQSPKSRCTSPAHQLTAPQVLVMCYYMLLQHHGLL